MNIIIPVCGKGERFKKNGYSMPKPLINIFDKEMIFYVIDNLHLENHQIFIIYKSELDNHNFSSIIKNKCAFVKLIKIYQETSGASETIKLGLVEIMKKYDHYQKCLILDCDTFYTQNVIEMYNNINDNAVFYTFNNENVPIYSYINLNDENTITNIVEKEKISDNACTGIYCFSNINDLYKYASKVVNLNINFKGEPYVSCIISEMINDGYIFKGIMLDDICVFNLGTPHQLNMYINQTYAFMFDLDGTIVLTDQIYYEVWNHILKKYNIELTNEIYSNYIIGNNDKNLFELMMPNVNVNINDISQLKDDLFCQHLDKIKFVDGVCNFMIDLKKRGQKICIVTNCNKYAAEQIIKKCNLHNLIDFVIYGNECEKTKPYPDPYLSALQKYNINPNRSFIFEDSKTGILSGKSVSPKCLIGLATSYDKKNMLNAGCNIAIIDYNEISFDYLIKYNNMFTNKIKHYILTSMCQYDVNDVIIDSEKLKGGYISDVISVKIIFKNGKEKYCVVKFENENETNLSTMARNLDLYGREYYFYENISKYVNINIPHFYALIKDDNFNNIGILMENLAVKKFTLNMNLNESNIDISLKIISACAKLHAKFWNKNLSSIFPQLKKHDNFMFKVNMLDFIKNKWISFNDKWKNMLNDQQLKIAKQIMLNFENIQNNLSNCDLTLCHGDVKSPNIFYKKIDENMYDPYFIDWQYVNIGKGIQDIVFFMIESYDVQKIKILCPIFKNYYYEKIMEFGVQNYSYDNYEKDFINAICYFPFFVAIWFGTVSFDDLIDKNFPFFFIQKLFSFIGDNKIFNVELFNQMYT